LLGRFNDTLEPTSGVVEIMLADGTKYRHELRRGMDPTDDIARFNARAAARPPA
jgi:hypothetical protein